MDEVGDNKELIIHALCTQKDIEYDNEMEYIPDAFIAGIRKKR